MIIIQTSKGPIGISFRYLRPDLKLKIFLEERSPEALQDLKETIGNIKSVTHRSMSDAMSVINTLNAKIISDPESFVFNMDRHMFAPYTVCNIYKLTDEYIQKRAELINNLSLTELQELNKNLDLERIGRSAVRPDLIEDTFDKKKGRKISLTRALEQFPRELRKEIWNEYTKIESLPRTSWSYSREKLQKARRGSIKEAVQSFNKLVQEKLKS